MMIVSDSSLGCSGLLRVSGLPIRYWLAGANPTLFEKVTCLERAEDARRKSAIRLAERIGRRLVPNQVICRRDRAFLLAVRRSLHRGDLITDVSRERLLELNGVSDRHAEVIEDIVARADGDRAIAKLLAELQTDVSKEEARLLLLPDEIQRESPVAKALLVVHDQGRPLSRKSRRHRNEHEWRCIARAATGCTPRGWLSHVALLTVEATDGPSPLTIADQFIAQWTENVRAGTTLAHLPDDWPAPDSRLAVNPLRWNVDGSLVCVVADESTEHTQLAVRHTALLKAICTALADAVRTFGELSQSLGCVSHDECSMLRGFVRHLALLGILQPSAPPEIRLERPATPAHTNHRSVRFERDEAGWVDVYRYAEGGTSTEFASEVQRGVSQVLRILSLVGDYTPNLLSGALPGTDRLWTPIEILRADLDSAEASRSNPEFRGLADDEVSQTSSASGFDRLVRAVAEHAAHSRELVIDSALLDSCGASNGQFTWPIDCLVRVPAGGASFTAVLDQLWPPGMLDARFVDTLVDLHGALPHVEAYRQFLHRLEELTGILFVELLLPPLRDGAANAVRRPIYTSAWTGDPRAAVYLRAETHPGRYIPLDAIRIRRVAGRLRAEVDGRPIWPVYHATRSFSPPWDRLARLLLATAPLELPWDFKRVLRSLTLVPRRAAVPRISLGGRLVLSPAQWRVSPEQVWDRGASTLQKIRALIRLRNRYSLPRWVYLDRPENTPPIPCDLESLYAIRTIERCVTGSSLLNITEMLPAPHQFPATDRAHSKADRLATQFHLRFPCDESATAMAARVAPMILSALGPFDLRTTATRTMVTAEGGIRVRLTGGSHRAADTLTRKGGLYGRHR